MSLMRPKRHVRRLSGPLSENQHCFGKSSLKRWLAMDLKFVPLQVLLTREQRMTRDRYAMGSIIRIIACGVVALFCLMPVSAMAITPDVPETPGKSETPNETEKPGEDPVTEDRSPPEKESKKKKPVKKVIVTTKTFEPSGDTYPVHSKSNYCPAGLQPVTISGSISCGSPTTHVTYNQMLSHPTVKVRKKHPVVQHRSAHPTCAIGAKGCSGR